MIKCIISLIPKEVDTKNLNFRRPITLLITAYIIFVNTFQIMLQPVFKNIITSEQSAFLPLKFILDNIVLTQETLCWVKTSQDR